jgi:hypothetical protein
MCSVDLRPAALAVALAWALAADPQPVKLAMTAAAGTPLRKGAKVEARITAKIDTGWRLYALDQVAGGPFPTVITVPPGQSFAAAGPARQSDPLAGFDNTFELDTRYFVEEASFAVPVTVQADLPDGSKLRVNFTYQTCNENECLPPSTVKLEAPVGGKE